MPVFHLAQLNIARMRTSMEDPIMVDFVANLDRINALADTAPGFVWRLQDEAGNATAIRPFGDDMLVNLSVWEDPGSLKAFVFRKDHAEIMKRRSEWFHRLDAPYVVLWWVAAGHLPTEVEAGERLLRLRAEGPSPSAFNFRRPFGPPC